jgi:hypothetical protein
MVEKKGFLQRFRRSKSEEEKKNVPHHKIKTDKDKKK